MNLRDALRVPSAEVTDESVWQARRHLVAGLACLPAVGLAGCAGAEPDVHASPSHLGGDSHRTILPGVGDDLCFGGIVLCIEHARIHTKIGEEAGEPL